MEPRQDPFNLRRWSVLWVYGLLLAIVVLAFALRLYRLDQQSVWSDEFDSFPKDAQASFLEFMTYYRTANPDHVPLYFVALFSWIQSGGIDPVHLRMFSVLFGVGVIPVVFLIGRRLMSPSAGLLAALLVALSPSLIWHSQGIRSYAMLLFFAALGLWGLLRGLEGRRSGWVVHGASSLVLAMTHITAFPFMAFQGAYLLLHRPFSWRVVILWSIYHLGLVAVVLAILPLRTLGALEYFDIPTLPAFAADLLGDDALVWRNRLTAHAMGNVYTSYGLAGLYLLAAASLCLLSLYTSLVRRMPRMVWVLAFTAFGPPLLVLAMSFLWNPIARAQYTLSSSLSVCLLVALGACQIRSVWWRRGIVAFIVAFLSVQLLLYLPGYTRPHLKGVAEMLTREVTAEDRILAVDNTSPLALSLPVRLRYHLGTFPALVGVAHTLQDLLRRTDELLQPDEDGVSRVVWAVVHETAIRPTRQERFLEALAELDIEHEVTSIPNFHVFKCWREGASPPRPATTLVSSRDYSIWRDLCPPETMNVPQPPWDQMERTLRYSVDWKYSPMENPEFIMRAGLVALEHDWATGAWLIHCAYSRAPDSSMAQTAMGILLSAEGDPTASMYLDLALEGQEPRLVAYQPYMRAIRDGDPIAGRAALNRIEALGYVFPEAMWYAVGKKPDIKRIVPVPQLRSGRIRSTG